MGMAEQCRVLDRANLWLTYILIDLASLKHDA